MYLKRTLVLCGGEDKCILSLEKNSEPTAHFKTKKGNFAVFQFNDAPMELYELKDVGSEKTCLLPTYIDLSGDISCAVLNDKAEILMFGATRQKESFRVSVQKNYDHFLAQIKSLSVVEASSSTGESDLEVERLFEQSDEDVDNAITDTLLTECLNRDSVCEGCVYKKAFYEVKSAEESTPPIEEKTEDTLNFFDQVKNSIENLFETYPVNQELVDAIDNSQFVKVDYEGDGNFYSVGLIFDEEDLKYICYAIPSSEGESPPKELQEFSQWLKIRDGYGYWLTYQDGKTGESVTLN